MKDVNQLFSLKNRVVLLTGATGHLGQAMAWGLCQAGAHVIINGRSPEKVERLTQYLSQHDFSASPMSGDITQEDFITSLSQTIKKEFHQLDAIVHNSYKGRTCDLDHAEREDFHSALNITVNAAYCLYRHTKELLLTAAQKNYGGASIVLTSSMYGHVSPDPSIYEDSGFNNPPFYGVAKAGLLQLTRYMAAHLGKEKIRVNAISPGPFPQGDVQEKHPRFHEKLCQKNPLGRTGKAEELIGALLFLTSDASSYVTGINLPVDGGWTSW